MVASTERKAVQGAELARFLRRKIGVFGSLRLPHFLRVLD
jgi:hypothetical protein